MTNWVVMSCRLPDCSKLILAELHRHPSAELGLQAFSARLMKVVLAPPSQPVNLRLQGPAVIDPCRCPSATAVSRRGDCISEPPEAMTRIHKLKEFTLVCSTPLPPVKIGLVASQIQSDPAGIPSSCTGAQVRPPSSVVAMTCAPLGCVSPNPLEQPQVSQPRCGVLNMSPVCEQSNARFPSPRSGALLTSDQSRPPSEVAYTRR